MQRVNSGLIFSMDNTEPSMIEEPPSEVPPRLSASSPGPSDQELFSLTGLVDEDYDYWEPDKYSSDEPRVHMSSNPAFSDRPEKELPSELDERVIYWNLKETTLQVPQLASLTTLLDEFVDVFAKDEYDLGRFTAWEHSVNTGDHLPIRAKPRPLSHDKQECLKVILDNLERTKQIRPSRSDWASGIVMVPKKDKSWRMCMDFRPLNRIATCCQFPIPRINDMLQSLRGATYFSALDLAKGFHQIPLAEDSKHKLAFVTPLGQWEWETTPMGLHSAPAAFQAAMQQTLAGLQHCTLVYIDDIVIFTNTFEEHLAAAREVFLRLREFNLKANRLKCDFARTEITYLGHVVNAQGIHTDPKKTAAIDLMPEPQCTLDVETFLGKAGYYHRFIKDYSNVAYPLMQMKRKDATFHMGEPQKEAFRLLKLALVNPPVLGFADPTRPLYIATDASGYAAGAVLFQKYTLADGSIEERPIAYASKTFKGPELRYSATEREAYAVWWALDHFVEYVEGHKVTVYSDHKALTSLPQKEMSNRRLQLIAHKLSEFQYTIEYRPGKDNANADALSRYPIVPCKGRRSKEVQTNESVVNGYDSQDPLSDYVGKFKRIPPTPSDDPGPGIIPSVPPPGTKPQVMAVELTMPPPNLGATKIAFAQLAQLQERVPEFKVLREYYDTGVLPEDTPLRRDIHRTIDQFYCREDGVLCRTDVQGRSAICAPPSLRETILYDMHTAPAAGHLGIAKTLARVQERYWWPGMARFVGDYVQLCPLCQIHKERARPPREPMGDRPPPGAPWERLHMDVWGPGGRSTRGNLYVLGVVDTFTKFLMLVPMPNEQADTISEAIVEHVMMPYGMPWEIVSDQAPSFTGQLQSELYAIFGVTRKVTTPYRPQANGQIERMFRSIRPIVATLAARCPRNWDRYLAMAAHSYNTSYHAGVKNTPFQLMYGRLPDPLPEHHQEAESTDNVDRLRRWKIAREAARVGLCLDQQRSKENFDAHRARPQTEYAVGDCVLVKTTYVPPDNVRKLYPKYVGPFEIKEIEGSVLRLAALHNPRQTGRLKTVHIDRVRPAQENHPNVHTWAELQNPFADSALGDPSLDREVE